MATATTLAAEGSLFELWAGPFRATDLAVVTVRGREEISRTFRFDLLVRTAVEVDSFEGALLGQPATLLMRSASGAPRVIHGIVARVERVAASGSHAALSLRIVPRLWLLSHRTTSRVFQDMAVPAVVSAVLHEMRIPFEWRCTAEYPPRSYCVQYDETDLAFVERLLAEEGIHYYFEHPAGEEGAPPTNVEEVAVFGDAPAYPWIAADPSAGDGDPTLVLRSHTGARSTDDDVSAFKRRREVAPTAYLLRDYDFRRPMLDLRAEVEGKGDDADEARTLRVYEHRSDYEEPDVNDRRAKVELEQLRRKAVSARGNSTCRRLLPGHRFHLDVEDAADLSGDYVITRVDHEGQTPELVAGGATWTYKNAFRCLPANVAARPKKPERRVRQVTETATVVGPAGDEIHTDAYGRIRVRFHWDTGGRPDDLRSCWIRVVQAWAGMSWGAQFVPRVGMEVLVSFFDGDPDRPVVTGCLVNRTHPSTHLLPEHKTRSGLRTQTSPGGEGWNELRFEDRKGAEELFIQAQRDLNEVVKHDRTASVAGEDRLVVKGGQTTSIDGESKTSLGSGAAVDVRGDLSASIGGETKIVCAKGRTEKLGGDLSMTIAGTESHTIGAGLTMTVAKDSALEVKGRQETRVGSKDEGALLAIKGDYKITASGKVEIKADKGLSISAGSTTLEITPDLVKAMAKSLVLAGSSSTAIFGNGPFLHLGDKLAVSAENMLFKAGKELEISAPKKVKITTDNASIKLADDAEIAGSKVLLNCPPEPPPEKPKQETKKEDGPPPKTFLRLVMKDPKGKPYGKKKFELTVDGAKVGEGLTADDGLVEQEISPSAKSGELVVYVDEKKKIKVPVNIGKLGPIGTTSGVKARLKNLGYHHGAVDDNADDETTRAVSAFQRENDLKVTGEIDDATRNKLAQLTRPD